MDKFTGTRTPLAPQTPQRSATGAALNDTAAPQDTIAQMPAQARRSLPGRIHYAAHRLIEKLAGTGQRARQDIRQTMRTADGHMANVIKALSSSQPVERAQAGDCARQLLHTLSRLDKTTTDGSAFTGLNSGRFAERLQAQVHALPRQALDAMQASLDHPATAVTGPLKERLVFAVKAELLDRQMVSAQRAARGDLDTGSLRALKDSASELLALARAIEPTATPKTPLAGTPFTRNILEGLQNDASTELARRWVDEAAKGQATVEHMPLADFKALQWATDWLSRQAASDPGSQALKAMAAQVGARNARMEKAALDLFVASDMKTVPVQQLIACAQTLAEPRQSPAIAAALVAVNSEIRARSNDAVRQFQASLAACLHERRGEHTADLLLRAAVNALTAQGILDAHQGALRGGMARQWINEVIQSMRQTDVGSLHALQEYLSSDQGKVLRDALSSSANHIGRLALASGFLDTLISALTDVLYLDAPQRRTQGLRDLHPQTVAALQRHLLVEPSAGNAVLMDLTPIVKLAKAHLEANGYPGPSPTLAVNSPASLRYTQGMVLEMLKVARDPTEQALLQSWQQQIGAALSAR